MTRDNNAVALSVALDEAANDIMNLRREHKLGGHVPFENASAVSFPPAQPARLRENVAPFTASKQKYCQFQNLCSLDPWTFLSFIAMDDGERLIEKVRRKLPAAANERVKSALRGIAAGEPGLSERVDKCLDSVARYPLEIEAAKECKLLKGFNDEMVSKLEAKLKTVGANVSSSKSEAQKQHCNYILYLVSDDCPLAGLQQFVLRHGMGCISHRETGQ